MGADGMYPSYPYLNDNMGYNRPSYNPSGYPSSAHIPSYGMSYGRGFQRSHPPMNHYDPMMNGFLQELFPNQTGSRSFFKTPRATTAGFQSVTPSIAPNSNTQLNRPHFDEQ